MGTRVLCDDGKRDLCDDGTHPKTCLIRAKVCAGGLDNTYTNFWMNQSDASTLVGNHFTFDGAIKIEGTGPGYPDSFCNCLYFDFADSHSFNDGTLAAPFLPTPSTLHPLSDGDPVDDAALTVDGVFDCVACSLRCLDRMPCATYLAASTVAIKVWDPVRDPVTGDFVVNPHSCWGDDTAPPDYTGGATLSFLLTKSGFCGFLEPDTQDVTYSDGHGGGGTITFGQPLPDPMLSPECALDGLVIGISGFSLPTTGIDLSRAREATVDGAYPGNTVCVQDANHVAYQISITAATVVCADGI